MTAKEKGQPGEARAPLNPATRTLKAPATVHAPSLPKRWRLIRLLGRGGQAEVWLALDRQIDQMVAVKVFDENLSADATRRFRREVSLGRTLEHPSLARIFELIDTGNRLAIVMQWYPHGSLADSPETTPMPIPRVISIANEVLGALAYLHSREIVHRDIKPSNLLIGNDNKVVLGDLGLARSFGGGTGWTQTLTTAGTPRFMSPEQLLGQNPGPPSDLYSLGVTLFLLLTGRLPFEGESDFEIADRQLHSRPPHPRRFRPDCPRWLARFVLRLMEKSPRDRWPDAAAAVRAFQRRRALASPRTLRRGAWGAAFSVFAVGAFVLFGRHIPTLLARPTPPRVISEGRQVRALGKHGHVAWSFTCRSRVRQVLSGDLLPGPGREYIAVSAPVIGGSQRISTPHRSSVVILNQQGGLVTELLPRNRVLAHSAEPLAPPLLVPRAIVADLDGDGLAEVLVTAHHRTLGTSYLFVYWPRYDAWRMVLDHSGGWIFNVAPVPGTSPARIRLFAFNSLMGSFDTISELILPAPQTAARTERSAGVQGGQPTDGARFAWYTPLGQTFPGPVAGAFTCRTDGGMRFQSNGHRWVVDRWGNPVPGPNAGRDMSRSRMDLFRGLEELRPEGFAGNLEALHEMTHALENKFRLVLREKPVRGAFIFLVAQKLAIAGDLAHAIHLLRVEWSNTSYDGLGLELAHLQAVSGDLNGAAASLQKLIASGTTPESLFRGPELFRRVAIESESRALFEHALSLSSDFAPRPELQAIARARARLWWNRPTTADTSLHSYDLAPAGEALACLARWRLGMIRKDDPKAMTEAMRRNPDALAEGLLARAMARTSLGRPAAALADLNTFAAHFSTKASYDFRLFQLLQLARACRAKVLLISGQKAEALTVARKLRPTLRPGLLPRIVVDEVLAGEVHGRSAEAMDDHRLLDDTRVAAGRR